MKLDNLVTYILWDFVISDFGRILVKFSRVIISLQSLFKPFNNMVYVLLSLPAVSIKDFKDWRRAGLHTCCELLSR